MLADLLTERGAPSSPHAERTLLGAFMLESEQTSEQTRGLEPWMFSLDSHRTLHRVLLSMAAEGRGIDLTTVIEELGRCKKLEEIGGREYLFSLTEDLPYRLNVTEYSDAIREKWRLREVMRIGATYSAKAVDASGETSDGILSQMQGEVFDVMQDSATVEDPLVSAYTIRELEELLDTTTSTMGWSYGHHELDRYTLGMQRREITVVGARSGVGKSVLMLQAAAASCSRGMAVDLFSLEMSKGQLLRRLWALESGVSARKIRRKWLNESERRAVREAAYRVAEWKLRVHDDSEMTLIQICARARLSARRFDMKWFGVDYCQIVNVEGRDERLKMAAVSRTLTKLAKKEAVHGMLLSQLRKVDREHYSKPPSVADLRETGQFENDAHAIILIHRGWDEATSKIELNGEFIMPKLRNEETGAIPNTFNGTLLRFE